MQDILSRVKVLKRTLIFEKEEEKNNLSAGTASEENDKWKYDKTESCQTAE
jgi:hypothetical protein